MKIWNVVSEDIKTAVVARHLPESFLMTVKDFYFPLAEKITERCSISDRPLIVGVNGAQGTGKSTLADFLKILLQSGWALNVASFSIDDIYLTRDERNTLANSVHPLLKTRGVPGTHDVQLGLDTLERLIQASADERIAVPQFNKAVDDRIGKQHWPTQNGNIDVILLEGWCVAAIPEKGSALIEPVNTLERDEDSSGCWRRYVNDCLAGEYQQLFKVLDLLVMLKAPSMECVIEWRGLQEKKLSSVNGGKGSGLMDHQQLLRFIQHYERLTRHMLQEMPGRADCVFHLATDHHIEKATGPLGEALGDATDHCS